jgi:hypothetical protein
LIRLSDCGLLGQLLDQMLDGLKPVAEEKTNRNDYAVSHSEYSEELDPLTL